MENAAEALKIGFAVLVFVIAITLTFSMMSQARQTADLVFYTQDDTKYLDDNLEGITNIGSKDSTQRTVGLETIIPTIYRYAKENYGVTIIDNSEIVARFDVETETIAQNWSRDEQTNSSSNNKNHLKYLNDKVFNNGNYNIELDYNKLEGYFKTIYKLENSLQSFGAPWLSSDEGTIKRIDADIGGGDATYSTGNHESLELLRKYKDKKFTEYFKTINTTQANGEIKTKTEIIYVVNN